MQNSKDPWNSQSSLPTRNQFYSDTSLGSQQPKIGSYRAVIKKDLDLDKNDEGKVTYSIAINMQPQFTKLSSIMIRIEDYYLMRTHQLNRDHGCLLKASLNNTEISTQVINKNDVMKPNFILNRESSSNSQQQMNQQNQNNYNTNNRNNYSSNNQNNSNNINQNNIFGASQSNVLQSNNNLLNQQQNYPQNSIHNPNLYPNTQMNQRNDGTVTSSKINQFSWIQSQNPQMQNQQNSTNQQQQPLQQTSSYNQINSQQQQNIQQNNQINQCQIQNQEIYQLSTNDQNREYHQVYEPQFLQGSQQIPNIQTQTNNQNINITKNIAQSINQIVPVTHNILPQNNINQQVTTIQNPIYQPQLQTPQQLQQSQQQLLQNQQQQQNMLMNQFNQPDFQLYMQNPSNLSNLINCLELLKTPSDKKTDQAVYQKDNWDDSQIEKPIQLILRSKHDPYKKSNTLNERNQANRIQINKSSNNMSQNYNVSQFLNGSRIENSRISNISTSQNKNFLFHNKSLNENKIQNISTQSKQWVKDKLHQHDEKKNKAITLNIQFACSGKFSEQVNGILSSLTIDEIILTQLNKIKDQGLINHKDFPSFVEHSYIIYNDQTLSGTLTIREQIKHQSENITLLVSNQEFKPIFNDQYIYSPTSSDLISMSSSQLRQVFELKITNQYGTLIFPGITDVNYVDFKKSLIITEGCVMVYDELTTPLIMYPDQNNKLNKSCKATLRIPKKILDKFQLPQKSQYDHLQMEFYIKKLMQSQDLQFEAYDRDYLNYTFTIPNFNFSL